MKKKILPLIIAVLAAVCLLSLAACVKPAVEKPLTGIELSTPPATTVYTEGEFIDPAGMVVTAQYSDNTSEPVTGYTYKTDALTTADTKIEVSYAKNDVTKTAEVAVTVNPMQIVNAQTPVITAQPSGAVVTVGAAHNLTVAANVTDGGTLTYQWYSNASASTFGGTPINGAINASLTVPTDTEGTFYYYVIVTNTNDAAIGTKTASVISNAATLAVGVTLSAEMPLFTKQSVVLPLTVGEVYPLSVEASVTDGGSLTYQWYSNVSASTLGGTPIDGATNANYTVPTDTAGTLYYYVIVTNTNDMANGEKTAETVSSVFTITVIPSSLPKNVAALIEAIDLLPPIEKLYYSNNAAIVKYLMGEYAGLSEQDKASITNYASLTAANAKIDELAMSREIEVHYDYNDYPSVSDYQSNNPDTYTPSQGEGVLNAPLWRNTNIEFVEWREYYTNTPVTTLAQALELTTANFIRVRPVFSTVVVVKTITVEFTDEEDGETLYEVTLTVDGNYLVVGDSIYYDSYYFASNTRDLIAAECGRYPISYDYSGRDYINVDDVSSQQSTLIQVSVTTVAMRELTFPAENKYEWVLSYSYIDENEDYHEEYGGGQINGDVTSCFLPVGFRVSISARTSDITAVSIDGTKTDGDYTSFTLAEDTSAVAVEFIKGSADTKARVIFARSNKDYYAGDPIYTAEFEADSWDGIFTENELDFLYNQ
jgi:hypothetical protein